VTLDTSDWKIKFEVKRSGQGHWKRKCKSFCAYLREKWIDLRQTTTKRINGLFYTYY